MTYVHEIKFYFCSNGTLKVALYDNPPLFRILKGFTIATIGTVATAFGLLGYMLPGQAVIISTSSGQVGNVDVATGVFTPFVNSGPAFTDIAISDSGQIYGTNSSQLFSINQSQGSSTLIGNENVGDLNGLGFANNNALYGTEISGEFDAISPFTGSTTLISNPPGFHSSGDIIFNPTTNQFLATSLSPNDNILFSIDLNGAGTRIGNIGSSGVFGLAFNRGTLYGYTDDGKQLIINPTTGIGTLDKQVTGFSGQIFGAASFNSEAQPIPEPRTLTSIIAAGFIGAWLKLRQKPFQTAR